MLLLLANIFDLWTVKYRSVLLLMVSTVNKLYRNSFPNTFRFILFWLLCVVLFLFVLFLLLSLFKNFSTGTKQLLDKYYAFFVSSCHGQVISDQLPVWLKQFYSYFSSVWLQKCTSTTATGDCFFSQGTVIQIMFKVLKLLGLQFSL